MKKPVISVIAPVYNVEDYLTECLESILNQTFADFELICVNDGSTDSSRAILEKYKQRDCRIKIIDKPNGGLSSARNAGMKIAQGEFISFIDSDDWIDRRMLEMLYNNITVMNSGISICAVHQYDENTKQIDDSNPYYTLGYFDSSFDNRVFSYKDVKPFIMDVPVTAWNKLFRRSLIDENGAVFPDGLIFEDGPFFFSLFFKTKRVSIVRDFLYYYRVNRKNSIIQKAGAKYLDVIDVTELMFNCIKNLDDFNDIRPVFFRKKVEDFVYRFDRLDKKYKKAFASKLIKSSSLVNDEIFPPSLARGSFRYNYFLFSCLKKGGAQYYKIQKIRIKLMYKVMEIIYHESNVYYLKYRKFMLRIKKRPNFYDISYNNDKISVRLLNKIKFSIPFKFSELEKFNEPD